MDELEAELLRSRRWVVRPKGQLGTCGFYPCAWTAQFVTASTAEEALRKASRHVFEEPK